MPMRQIIIILLSINFSLELSSLEFLREQKYNTRGQTKSSYLKAFLRIIQLKFHGILKMDIICI